MLPHLQPGDQRAGQSGKDSAQVPLGGCRREQQNGSSQCQRLAHLDHHEIPIRDLLALAGFAPVPFALVFDAPLHIQLTALFEGQGSGLAHARRNLRPVAEFAPEAEGHRGLIFRQGFEVRKQLAVGFPRRKRDGIGFGIGHVTPGQALGRFRHRSSAIPGFFRLQRLPHGGQHETGGRPSRAAQSQHLAVPREHPGQGAEHRTGNQCTENQSRKPQVPFLRHARGAVGREIHGGIIVFRDGGQDWADGLGHVRVPRLGALPLFSNGGIGYYASTLLDKGKNWAETLGPFTPSAQLVQ